MSDFSELNHIASVTMMLADSAQVADGKLFILGGGVSVIPAGPQPVALAMIIEIPWDRANIRHNWKIELLDEDGAPVMAGDLPVLVGGEFETGRPPGLSPGTPLAIPLAINFAALPVEADTTYLWRLAINDTSEPEWQRRFTVAPDSGV